MIIISDILFLYFNTKFENNPINIIQWINHINPVIFTLRYTLWYSISIPISFKFSSTRSMRFRNAIISWTRNVKSRKFNLIRIGKKISFSFSIKKKKKWKLRKLKILTSLKIHYLRFIPTRYYYNYVSIEKNEK